MHLPHFLLLSATIALAHGWKIKAYTDAECQGTSKEFEWNGYDCHKFNRDIKNAFRCFDVVDMNTDHDQFTAYVGENCDSNENSHSDSEGNPNIFTGGRVVTGGRAIGSVQMRRWKN